MSVPAGLREQALAAEKAGDMDLARGLFRKAAALAQNDAPLLNSIAGFHFRNGDFGEAERLYRNAHKLLPRSPEYATNLALALGKLGRKGEALQLLEQAESIASGDARYWSTRASAERDAGKLVQAEASYDKSIVIQPNQARALHGRARISLERSDRDAAERYAAALSANQGDLEAWLGYAQALELGGDLPRAIEIAEILVKQAPTWIEALNVLTQFRLARGDKDFASHFDTARTAAPADKSIILAHCRALSGLDYFAEAAEAAARGRIALPDDEGLALLEAIHRGEAGDDDRAEDIFSHLKMQTYPRKVHEARHRLRRQEFERAEALLSDALALDSNSIAAWALRGIAWRLLGDSRLEWLYSAEGFVRPIALDLDSETFVSLRTLLHQLHDNAALPLNQSVRGGTQTRGALLARREPELAALEASLLRALEDYRRGLPPYDPSHPLLRHRDTPWHIFGSWSVRLLNGGRHTEHIHPQGIVSSALYVDLHQPDSADAMAGWLELGRPAPDLRLDLPPLFEIEPQAGRLALFPSTLYHGTRNFDQGRRLTVAYDVAPTG